MNKIFATDPIKQQAKSGRAGEKFKKWQNEASSILVNPFTAEAEKDAFKAGLRSRKKAT